MSKLRSEVEVLKRKMKSVEESITKIKERNIVEDLGRETYYGSGRFFYTYDEIANKNETSASTVARIAEKNKLSRRNLRSV